jgi:biotin transport system substrate-specific component
MALTLTTPNTVLGALQPRRDAAKLALNLAIVVLGTLVLTIAAKINVPVWPVPVTLQTFAVAALAGAFGARIGVATVALYLLQGAAGLPVFAGGGGAAYLLGPTSGFLISWLLMAFIIGRAADIGATRSPLTLLAAMLVGNAVQFAFGFLWLMTMAGQAGWIDQSNVVLSAYKGAVEPFIVWDILKMAFAALTVTGLWQVFKPKA